ncbi:hypothetical protein [Microbacterium sp. YY-01]|uniref:hypothetical protein n=1 Tax=Microbacterium sp. YY-01 TaxID=3421634 RepID=UPI003D16598D
MNPTPQPLFNPQALTANPTPAELKAFREHVRASSLSLSLPQRSAVIGIIIAAVIGAPVFIFGLAAVFFSVSTASRSGSAARLLAALLPFLLVGVIVGGVIWLVIAMVRKSRRDHYRFFRFAQDNNMTYINSLHDVPLPGMIFSQGYARRSDAIVRGLQPRFVEFANYQYTTGGGKNSTTHRWGYVAVKLDVPLPHIVLDAASNNHFFGSNLPVHFPGDQHLSLEGDFDNYFRLYCPEGYERDALYLFTPDILVRLMDNVATLDVEIVDDWLFLYRNGTAVTLDPYVWHQLFTAVASLLEKIYQWSRWRDDRLQQEWHFAAAPVGAAAPPPPAAVGVAGPVTPPPAPGVLTPPPPGVAQPGRRLRQGVRWKTVLIILGIAAAFFLLPMAGMFISIMMGLR